MTALPAESRCMVSAPTLTYNPLTSSLLTRCVSIAGANRSATPSKSWPFKAPIWFACPRYSRASLARSLF